MLLFMLLMHTTATLSGEEGMVMVATLDSSQTDNGYSRSRIVFNPSKISIVLPMNNMIHQCQKPLLENIPADSVS
ncbi:hypothetical protein Cadr_000015157 [Camelus dromedarius]|uniref:Uncharacterized protein n=1 Tax=Camelus dromedarius TaxID=9838 RepID=A0A5N4DKS5_CAMDR|nr:hypothetical protein Cadr_000015157 [Camelus dromedarius]